MLFKNARLKREEEIRQLKAEGAKKAGIAFAVGSALAAVVTIFTTPKSGKEMREDVSKKVEEGADLVKEKGELLAVKTAEMLEDTVEKGKSIKDKVVAKLPASKDTWAKKSKEAIDEAEEVVDEAVENAAESAKKAVDKAEEVKENVKKEADK